MSEPKTAFHLLVFPGADSANPGADAPLTKGTVKMSIKIGNDGPAKTRIDAMRADAERRYALLEIQAAGALRRVGIQATGAKLNIYELDRVLAEKRMLPGDRIALKSQLAQLGWID
ncbi:MAG: hypothetical protein WBG18_07250 [Xanthobacteraceae bacterium]